MDSPRDASSCFVCSQTNPVGLHVTFAVAGGRVTGEFVPSDLHVGFSRVVHGGILAAVLDDALAAIGYYQGEPTVTARLAVRYRKSAVPGVPLRVAAEETGRRGALRHGKAVLTEADGTVIAEAEGTMVVMDGEGA